MKHKREIIESEYPPKNNEDIWLKDLLLYASTTKGWLPLGSEKTYSSKEELLADKPAGGTIGIDKETGTAYLYNDVSKEWTPIGSSGMTETTWQELKDLRDNSQLTPGSLYRITDYQCTTTQENTQSAGHQFDIVLLALSEDKLAEEGWAMEHPTDVYDVTFADGVTKKCYYYRYQSGIDRHDVLVYIDTLLGLDYNSGTDDDLDNFINKTNKTINLSSTPITSELLNVPDLTYNYFQNSNLSAWKVWYCLDNDKDRFAWADDSVDESEPAKIQTNGSRGYTFPTNTTFIRDEQDDEIEEISGKTFYAWVKDDDNSTIAYTNSNPPLVGEEHLYIKGSRGFEEANGNTVDYYTPAHEGTGLPNGRGVIYRLIDEWNNDCPYDFKNIVIYLGGKIEKGYLFSSDDVDIFSDMSLTGIINDITVKKTINDNNCQVIDMGILVADVTGFCNIIVAGGALSENGVNTLPPNFIFGYTME